MCKRRTLATLAAIICLAGVVATLGAFAADKGVQRLRVRQSISAPLEVAIVGPRSFADWAEALLRERGTCWRPAGRGTDSFKIDWGDADGGVLDWGWLLATDGCPDKLTHVYAKPGVYTIRAIRTHPGPHDGGVIGWRGEATIAVRP